MYRRVHTRGKWRDVRRPTRWRSSNGLEAAQTIHSFHSVESTVHQCFDFIVDCCYYRCPLYNDNLRLLSNHIQLPLAWHRDNSWESAMDQKIVWHHKLRFPVLVVLWRCAFTFSTIPGNGVEGETVLSSFPPVFFGCTLSRGSSTP